MFRFFENLVDPYTRYTATDRPPQKLFSFLWDFSQPFKKLFAVTACDAEYKVGQPAETRDLETGRIDTCKRFEFRDRGTGLFDFLASHGTTGVQDEGHVLGERLELVGSKEVDKVAVDDLDLVGQAQRNVGQRLGQGTYAYGVRFARSLDDG